MEEKKIRSFTDLLVWQKGHQLVLSTYKVLKSFPDNEKFVLVSQMSRSAISVTSNIAEGFSRQSKKEKIQFYFHSLGSLTELQNQLLIAKELEYLTEDKFNELAKLAVATHKLLNGLIKSIKNSM